MQKVTIGIPTFNEGQNILNLLRALETDIPRDYLISEIIISDDSSDDTPEKVYGFLTSSSLNIKFIHHNGRRGAAAAWNEIFERSMGDIIVLYDADIIVGQRCTERLVSSIWGKIGLCASNPKPIKVKGIAAGASIFISDWLRSVRNNRLSQYTVMGRAMSIRSDIAKKISIPDDIIAIDLYVHCKVLECGFDVVYNDNAVVYFYPPTRISDFLSQVVRATNGHRQIRDCISRFKINLPKLVRTIEIIRNMFINPFGVLSVIVCCALIPFYKVKLKETNSAKWHTAKSTKQFS
ncbi:MAG: glycosyltransferase [Nitrososphaeraceae archaeon]|nr:glycosyltransferase [Nitrososphaeraceae archaeon]